MKKRTENNNLFSFNTFGSLLTAGLLVFGAASCNTGERETEDTAVVTTEEELDEGLDYEGTQENQPVTNTNTEDFERYDLNTDRQMDREEFDSRMNTTGEYTEWDTDRDGTINETEFVDGSSLYLNENQSNTEMDNQPTGITDTPTSMEIGTFDEWDQNNDGVITEEEFNDARFNTMDTNRDGSLSTDEYNMGNRQMNRGMETETGTNNGNR